MNQRILFKILKNVLILSVLSTTACSEYINQGSEPSDEQLLIQAKQDYSDKNYQESYRNLFTLAKKNNKEALYALGYMYYYGHGVDENHGLAQDLIRQSADLGYSPAIKALRIFSATKSTFSVDSAHASYISGNDLPVKAVRKSKPKEIRVEKTEIKAESSEGKIKTTEIAGAEGNLDFSNIEEDKPLDPAVENFLEAKELKELKESQELISRPKIAAATTPSKITPISEPESSTKKNVPPTPNDNRKPKHTTHPGTKSLIEKIQKHTTEDFWSNDDNNTSITEKVAQIDVQADHQADPQVNVTEWLKIQSPEKYTIQISANNNKEELDKFIVANNLQNKVKTFSYAYNNKTWYGASFGVYNTPSEAYQALLADLPTHLKLTKPWVRQFKNIVPSDVG
ncbi:MAG: SPOR domain-containing protein [Gammaproteobacteria bacterium]|nr:SPOR domain-containing protein [Gammaproteobacteria bacterium]